MEESTEMLPAGNRTHPVTRTNIQVHSNSSMKLLISPFEDVDGKEASPHCTLSLISSEQNCFSFFSNLTPLKIGN
jgi:hypothetical protein